KKSGNLHTALTSQEKKNLDNIFARKTQRKVRNDFVIQYKSRYFQLGEIQKNVTIYKKDVIASTETDKITLRLKHMIHPHKTPEIFPLNTPGYLYKNPYGTSHGSPYDYDTHVPLIFSHKKTKSSFISDGKATVDIAPTIARLLGVKIPDFCDGTAIDF
ncbi:MAG: hypothetical protein ABGX43_03775, partial [Nitrospinaceae bacterium]